MTPATLPLWAELSASVLLVISAVLCLAGALGTVRLPVFFLRMHAPALAATAGTWSAALASIVCLSFVEGRLMLQPWVIVILLAITVPVSTVLLMRAGLFRARMANDASARPDDASPER